MERDFLNTEMKNGGDFAMELPLVSDFLTDRKSVGRERVC